MKQKLLQLDSPQPLMRSSGGGSVFNLQAKDEQEENVAMCASKPPRRPQRRAVANEISADDAVKAGSL